MPIYLLVPIYLLMSILLMPINLLKEGGVSVSMLTILRNGCKDFLGGR